MKRDLIIDDMLAIRNHFSTNGLNAGENGLLGRQVISILLCKMLNEKRTENADFSEQTVRFLFSELSATSSLSSIVPGLNLSNDAIQFICDRVCKYHVLTEDYEAIEIAYEIMNSNSHRHKTAQYFTPRSVVELVLDMVDINNQHNIADISCGTGSFLYAAAQKGIRTPGLRIKGVELDSFLAAITEVRLKILGTNDVEIIKGDGLKQCIKENSQDLLLANPPYGLAILYEGRQKTSSEVAFIKKNIKLLREGGILAAVIPDGFLGNAKYENDRKWLLSQGRLHAVIDLPFETFEPYTATKTSIIIFEKTKRVTHDYKIFMAISENCGHDRRGISIKGEDFTEIKKAYHSWKASH